MRVMAMVKANTDSEAGVMPSEELLAEMGKFNEEMVKAGVLLAGEGLHPTSKGARVSFGGDGERTVIDGPFAETKELIAGYWLMQVRGRGRIVGGVGGAGLAGADGAAGRSALTRCRRGPRAAPAAIAGCDSSARENLPHARQLADRATGAEAALEHHLQWVRVGLAGGDEVGPAGLEGEVRVGRFAGLDAGRAVVDHKMPGVGVGEAPLVDEPGAVGGLRVDDALDDVEVEALQLGGRLRYAVGRAE